MQEVTLIRRRGKDGMIQLYIKYKPALKIPGMKPIDSERIPATLYADPKFPYQKTAN